MSNPMHEITKGIYDGLSMVGGTFLMSAEDHKDPKTNATAQRSVTRLRERGYAVDRHKNADGSVLWTTTKYEPGVAQLKRRPRPRKVKPEAQETARVAPSAPQPVHPAVTAMLRVTAVMEAPSGGLTLALTDTEGREWMTDLRGIV